MRFCKSVCTAFFFFALLSAAVLADTVTLDEPRSSFAIQPSSGALCAVASEKDLVSLYPSLGGKGTTDGQIDRAVGKTPVRVIFRDYAGKSFFIVACKGEKTIWVLDSTTLEVVKTISVKDAPLSLGSTLQQRSPFVFYGTADGLGAIDLRSFEDCPDLAPVGRQGAFHDLCVSSDGKLIYGRATSWSPTGRLVCSIDDEGAGPPTVNYLDYIHEDSSQFQADPFGPLVAFRHQQGNQADPYLAMADLPTPVSCFMRTRPIVLCLDQGILHFYSYNSQQELGSVSVSNADQNGAKPVRRRGRVYGNPPTDTVLVDEKDNTVLVCGKTSIQTIDLASVNLPKEPLLGVTVEGSTIFGPGANGSITLKKLNPDESVELKEPRPGMKITGDIFAWTPAASDVGDITLQLRIASGNFSRVQSIALSVRRPEIDLPFSPVQSVISPDGKLALLMGGPGVRTRRGRRQVQDGEQSGALALVDLDTRKVIAQKTLAKPLRFIALDNTHAYGTAAESDALYSFSLTDLSEERKVFASSPPMQMVLAGQKLYVTSQQGQTTEYSLPDLKPLDSAPSNPAMQFMYQNSGMGSPVRLGNQWLYKGVVYDNQMDHVIRVQNGVGFVEVNPAPFDPSAMNGGNQQAQGWGMQMQGNRLMRLPSQNIGTVAGNCPTFLNDLPALVTLGMDQSSPPRIRTTLDFYELLSATKASELVLNDEVQQNAQGSTQPFILSAAGRLAVIVQDKMYVVQTSALDASVFPAPPAVDAPAGVQTIEASGPSTLTFTASHMKAPVEFSLAVDRREIQIDKTTGKITVDGKALAESVADTLLQTINQQNSFGGYPGQFGGAPQQISASEKVERYRKTLVPAYQALTGSMPSGVPVVVRLDVVAIDGDQQKATCNVAAFLNVPKQLIVDRLNRQQAEFDANQRQAIANQNAMMSRGVSASQPGLDVAKLQGQVDKLTSQVADLQKQNLELTAQNKLLKDLVEQKNKPGN